MSDEYDKALAREDALHELRVRKAKDLVRMLDNDGRLSEKEKDGMSHEVVKVFGGRGANWFWLNVGREIERGCIEWLNVLKIAYPGLNVNLMSTKHGVGLNVSIFGCESNKKWSGGEGEGRMEISDEQPT
jgi:hypothetical protein